MYLRIATARVLMALIMFLPIIFDSSTSFIILLYSLATFTFISFILMPSLSKIPK